MPEVVRHQVRDTAKAHDSSKGSPARTFSQLTRSSKVLLQRKCACGKETIDGGGCEKCKAKAGLQRRAVLNHVAANRPALAPSIVHQALRSPGEPLDFRSRATFESHFDHDFSQVRLHRGSLAAESAHSVGAQAYTVGRHIVLGANARIDTPAGQDLLAHELAHVVQQSAATTIPAELEVTDAHGHAEREADQIADSAFAPKATDVRHTAAETHLANGPSVQRKLEGAVIGGVAGAIAGLTIGAIAFGPLGALVGGLAGAAVGALAGHLLTRGGKDGKDKDDTRTPLAKIADILKTGILRWSISQEEARTALVILKGVAPLELLHTLFILKVNHSWQKLLDHLSSEDREEAIQMDAAASSPESGPITPQDVFGIQVGSGSTGAKNSQDELEQPHDFSVDSNGLNLPYLNAPIPVTGMLPQDAANAISKAYTEANILDGPLVRLIAKKRNPAYYDSQPSGSAVITSNYVNEAGKAVKAAKLADFQAFIEDQPANTKHDIAAVAYFKQKMDAGLYAYDTPDVLWTEALNAQRTPPESPLKRFIEWGKTIEKQVAGAETPLEKIVLPKAQSKYNAWVSNHLNDPKLPQYDPEKIYGRSYDQALREYFADKRTDELKLLEREHESQEDAANLAKYIEINDKVMATILVPTPTQVISKGEEELNADNDPIKVSYLISASPEEKALRKKIADAYMEDVRKRKNQPGFAKISAAADLTNWLAARPDAQTALALTQAYPESERIEEKVEIQTWQTVVEIGVGFIPIVGQIVGVTEVIVGRDLSGHPISPSGRAILASALLLPAAAKIFKVGAAAVTASTLARDLRMSPAESEAVFRALAEIAPGKPGGVLLQAAHDDVLAGKVISDPARIEELNKLYERMGLTDRSTAEALATHPDSLLKGVETKASEEIAQEVKSLGFMDEASAQKLAADNELRQALLKSPTAAKLFKKCASPCYPPEMTADMVIFLENHLNRLKTSYAEADLEAVREYLYANRNNLNKALADIGAQRDLSNLNKFLKQGTAEAHRANFLAGNEVTPIKATDVTQRAYEIGEREGRIFAQTTEGLTPAGFVNPFLYIGSAGQGIDDIMFRGANLDTGIVYILEYKGGTSKLSGDQMTTAWVLRQIERLRNEGGAPGMKWADQLTKALKENRLQGIEISTPIVSGSPGVTKAGKRFTYP